MKALQLEKAFAKAKKRMVWIGDATAGVAAALDVEGRLFASLDGEILNRVNPEAIAGQNTRDRYLNPGGDGLWPAPEGTTLGYQYSTGAWRVPPGLRGARFLLTKAKDHSATIAAEVDLINDQGRGIPTLFQRNIRVAAGDGELTVRVVESVVYLGREPLRRSECLLAPWTLCQFDSGPGCEVVFPCSQKDAVWDLYDDPSDAQRAWTAKQCRTRTDGAQRYQIAIAPDAPWIEFRDPNRGLKVRRSAGVLPVGQSYIDIRDAAPDVPPGRKGIRYSVYSDPSRFMEIEAVGGCPAVIEPNCELRVTVTTRYVRT